MILQLWFVIVKTALNIVTTQVKPLHQWELATRPWQRIHLDFAGPFQQSMFLIIVDAYSKWPEVFPMSSTTSLKTIKILERLFCKFGLPKNLVTDNGPQLTSMKFQTFLKENGVHHTRTAPFRPATNGQAERFVQTMKQALRASVGDGGDPMKRLQRLLLAYRRTPHPSTCVTLAARFLGQELRTRIDLLRPTTPTHPDGEERKIKEFEPDQLVLVRVYDSKTVN